MELFYFLCHPGGDESKVEVIDMQLNLSYEKYEYALVNDIVWYDDVNEAIDYAKKLCIKYDLTYIRFESRYSNYGEDKEETSYLYL